MGGGIAGATTDGAGASPPWMTTSSPLLTSEFVRPRLERVTRSRRISLESGAVDESGCTGEIWLELGVRMGAATPAPPRDPVGAGGPHGRRLLRIPPAVGAGRLELACPTPRGSGEGRPSERNGWSWRAGARLAMLGRLPAPGEAATASSAAVTARETATDAVS